MRKYDIPYVPRGPANYYPVVALEDMSLPEIKKKHIDTCGKARGDFSICSRCKTPCEAGKRAVQLLANEVYSDPPIPLYGGKTLIERAREENIRRREMEKVKTEEAKEENVKVNEVKVEEKVKTRPEVPFTGWWEVSLKSGDQIKWLMDEMGITKAQAKKKIYQYKWSHGMTESKKSEKVEQRFDSIETKLEFLMKQQEEHKKAMDRYMELYNQEKEKFNAIKQKTDVLCSDVDIMNE